jgi:anti-sigma B factor antagonist
MQITERLIGDVTVLDLKGRFVEERGDDFRETMNRLVKGGVRKVLLNFDEITYVDSAGLGMLVAKYITLNKRDGHLKLCNLHRRSFRVLDVTRLLSIIESFESEAEAIQSFAAKPRSDDDVTHL